MAHYILVHGAWEAAWSRDEPRQMLEQIGHKVAAIGLPGIARNQRPFDQVTINSYVQAVADVIGPLDYKVTFVGHSLAGAVISQVAEVMPEKVERLICAATFLLEDNDSVIEAMQRDPDGEFRPQLAFSDDQSSVTVLPNV